MSTLMQNNFQNFSNDQIALLKNTVCVGATDNELALFMEVCKQTRLNPFTGQIYAMKRRVWDAKLNDYTEKLSIQTGIDGYRIVAERSGVYEGQVGPQWCGKDGSWKDVWLNDDHPSAARVGVWKKGFREPLWGIAKWSEYAQFKKDGKLIGMWLKMPAAQLAKCAESLALRKAFPNDLSSVYTKEEMDQAENNPKEVLVVEPGTLKVIPTTTPTKSRKEQILDAARILGWTERQIGECMFKSFKTSNSPDLNQAQFTELLSILSSDTYDEWCSRSLKEEDE